MLSFNIQEGPDYSRQDVINASKAQDYVAALFRLNEELRAILKYGASSRLDFTLGEGSSVELIQKLRDYICDHLPDEE